mmetsp:Transcript_25424/g.37547  ORF Transcript_25424/g.37547 Transcript_25424/m.37547 type:complete len:2310 (+) Transcript_25424:215-7144(+)
MAPTRSRRIAARRTRSRANTPEPEADTNEDDSTSSDPPQPPQPARRSARRTRSTTPTAAASTARRQRRNAAVSEDKKREDTKTKDTKTEDTEVGKVATRKSRRKAAEEEKEDTGTKKTPVRRTRRATSAKGSSKGDKKLKKQQKTGILDYFRRKDDEDSSESEGSQESEESQETGDKQEETGDSDGEQNKKSRTPLHEEEDDDDADNESDSSDGPKSSSEAEVTDEDRAKKDSSKEDSSDIDQDETDETDEVEATTRPQHERPSDKIDEDATDTNEKRSRTDPGLLKEPTLQNPNKSNSVSTIQNAALTRGAASKKEKQKRIILEEDKKLRKETKETPHKPELKPSQIEDEKKEVFKSESLPKQAVKNSSLASSNRKIPDSATGDKDPDPPPEKSKAETDQVISPTKDNKKAEHLITSKSPVSPKNIFFGGARIATESSETKVKQKGPTTHGTHTVKIASPKLQDRPFKTSRIDEVAKEDQGITNPPTSSLSQANDEDKNRDSLPENEGDVRQASAPKSTIQGSNVPVSAKMPKSPESQNADKDKDSEDLLEESKAKDNQMIASKSKIQGQASAAPGNTVIPTNAASQAKDKDPDCLFGKSTVGTDKSIALKSKIEGKVPAAWAITKIRTPSTESQANDKEKDPDSPLMKGKAETNAIISTIKDKDTDSPSDKSKTEIDQIISTTEDTKTEHSEGEKGDVETDQVISSENTSALEGEPSDLPSSSKIQKLAKENIRLKETISQGSKDGHAPSEVNRQDSATDNIKSETESKVLGEMAQPSQSKIEDPIANDIRRAAEIGDEGTSEKRNKSLLGTDTPRASEAEHVKIRNASIEKAESPKKNFESKFFECKLKQSNEDDTSSILTLEKKERESSLTSNEVTKADLTKSRLNAEEGAELGEEKKKLISCKEETDNPGDVIFNKDKCTPDTGKPPLGNVDSGEISTENADYNKVKTGHAKNEVSTTRIASENTDQKQAIQNSTLSSTSTDTTTLAETVATKHKKTLDASENALEIDASITLKSKPKSSKLDGEVSNEGDREPTLDDKQENSSLQTGDIKIENADVDSEKKDQLAKPEIKQGEGCEESKLLQDFQPKKDVVESRVKNEATSTEGEASSRVEVTEKIIGDAKRGKRPSSELSRHEFNNVTPGLVDDTGDGALEQKLRDTETMVQKRMKLSTRDHDTELSVEKEGPSQKSLNDGTNNAKSDSADSMMEYSGIETTSTAQNTHVQSSLLEAPTESEQKSMPDIRRPKVSIDQIKVRIYAVGYKTHHGKGAEKLFANYWDALCSFLGVSTNNNSTEKRYYKLNGTRKAINKFLTTKKLKRLHNMLILGLLNHADCTTALADDVLPHIPPRWRKRVKPLDDDRLKPSKASVVSDNDSAFETSIESDYNSRSVTWTASGVPENYSVISVDTKLSLCHDKTASPDYNSSPLPGALSMDPIIRSMAEKEGLKVSENAIWLIMVGMREYVKSLMKNTISCMNSINDANELPEVSELIQSIGPVSKDRVSTFKNGEFSQPLRTTVAGKRKCISALDLTSYLMLSPVACGRCPSNRTSFDHCFMSSFDPVLMSSQRDFEAFKNSIVSGIDIPAAKKQKTDVFEKSDRDPIFSPPENTKKETEKQSNQSKIQGENGDSSSEKATGAKATAPSNARRQVPMRGMGRGAKNLSALKARAAAAARAVSASDLTKLSKPSAATKSEEDLSSSKPKPHQSNPPEEKRAEKPSALVGPTMPQQHANQSELAIPVANNQQATASELQRASGSSMATDQNEERPKEAVNVARRGGRGFGVKNLRALMMKSKSNLDEKPEEKPEENPKVEERKEGDAATDADQVKYAMHKELSTANKVKTDVMQPEVLKINVNEAQAERTIALAGKERAHVEKVKMAEVGKIQSQKPEVEISKTQNSDASMEAEKVVVEDVDGKKSSLEKTQVEDPGQKCDIVSAEDKSLGTKAEVKEVCRTDDARKEEENTVCSNESKEGAQVKNLAVEPVGVMENVERAKVEKVDSEMVDVEKVEEKSLQEKSTDKKLEAADIVVRALQEAEISKSDEKVEEKSDKKSTNEKSIEAKAVDGAMIKVDKVEEKSIEDKATEKKVEVKGIAPKSPQETAIKESDEKVDVEMCGMENSDDKSTNEKSIEKKAQQEGVDQRLLEENNVAKTDVKDIDKNDVEMVDAEKSEEKPCDKEAEGEKIEQTSPQKDLLIKIDDQKGDKKAEVEKANVKIVEVGNSKPNPTEEKAKAEQTQQPEKEETAEISMRTPDATIEKSNPAQAKNADVSLGDASESEGNQQHTIAATEQGTDKETTSIENQTTNPPK